jgi:hypothetical protein
VGRLHTTIPMARQTNPLAIPAALPLETVLRCMTPPHNWQCGTLFSLMMNPPKANYRITKMNCKESSHIVSDCLRTAENGSIAISTYRLPSPVIYSTGMVIYLQNLHAWSVAHSFVH